MAFEVETRRTGAVAVAVLRGKVVLGDASQRLRDLIEQLLTDGSKQIVLNLAAVPFIDSAGLGTLTMSYTRVKSASGLLKIAEASSRVRDAVEVTRLTRIFPLYETEQEAIESFTSDRPAQADTERTAP